MKYPAILSEEATLDAMLAGASIARFGDGEWRCATGGACTSQRAEPKLAAELQTVLQSQRRGFLVGIPNPFDPRGAPRRESWIKYCDQKFTALLNAKTYASSFITRPDNAPWIDTPEYWAKVRELWQGRNIVLVSGDRKSLRPDMLSGAKEIIEVHGPRQHAYAEIDRIERDCLEASDYAPDPRYLICLGTAATVLATRLAASGYHALDLGHIGMFMRHAGAYRYQIDDLTSQDYRAQLQGLHAAQRWGADGAKHAEAVRQLILKFEPATILDYGCGENKLANALRPTRISGYDPGIPERAGMPKPCDLVVCTDVLEHVEPEKLGAVLDHIARCCGTAAYFVISCRPANAQLPDGRNAHLIIQPPDWWRQQIEAAGFKISRAEGSDKELRAVAIKPRI